MPNDQAMRALMPAKRVAQAELAGLRKAPMHRTHRVVLAMPAGAIFALGAVYWFVYVRKRA